MREEDQQALDCFQWEILSEGMGIFRDPEAVIDAFLEVAETEKIRYSEVSWNHPKIKAAMEANEIKEGEDKQSKQKPPVA